MRSCWRTLVSPVAHASIKFFPLVIKIYHHHRRRRHRHHHYHHHRHGDSQDLTQQLRLHEVCGIRNSQRPTLILRTTFKVARKTSSTPLTLTA